MIRYNDELYRHKILDFLGDFFLMGRPIIGSFFLIKSNHKLNNDVLNYLCLKTDLYYICFFNTRYGFIPF